MPANALDIELCHTIRYCWSSLDGQKAFKNVTIDEDLAKWLPDEFSREKQITNTWACGTSANRLCELLAGTELKEFTSAADAVDLANEVEVNKALEAMKATTGCVLVRINSLAEGAGHSYVFLSRFRESKSEPLVGQIYQTNVGCDQSSAFDLLAWISDPKYKQVVDLKAHRDDLRAGVANKDNLVSAYQRNYMLSTKTMKQYEKDKILQAKDATFRIQWRRLNPLVTRARLWNLRNPNPGKKWATVTTTAGFRSTN